MRSGGVVAGGVVAGVPSVLRAAAADCRPPGTRLAAAAADYRTALARYAGAEPSQPPPPDRSGAVGEVGAALGATVDLLERAAEALEQADLTPLGSAVIEQAADGGLSAGDAWAQHTRLRVGAGAAGAHAATAAAAGLLPPEEAAAWRRATVVGRASGVGTLALPGVEQALRDADDPSLSSGVRTARTGAAIGLDGGAGLLGGVVGGKAAGVLAGGATGALGGSFAPGVGTLIGGLTGALLGGYAGATAGQRLRAGQADRIDALGRRLDGAGQPGRASAPRPPASTPAGSATRPRPTSAHGSAARPRPGPQPHHTAGSARPAAAGAPGGAVAPHPSP